MSENLTDAETIAGLEIGLQRMPRLRREIFLAHRLDNMPYEESAERTGLTVRRVERHVARSMLTLLETVDGRAPMPWWKSFLHRIISKLRR
jgi:RNA polymerase sigma-70 factor (ECF subfamily)